jgi:prepilin peptidase CpaA
VANARWLKSLMGLSLTTWIFALALASYAGWIDWHTRRIPNWLTVAGIIAGFVLNSILNGWHGSLQSLEGAALALALLLPLVLLRGLGAGDWKLMGALGAITGWRPVLALLFVSVLISGFMAVIQMLLTGRVRTTLRNMLVVAKGLATFGLRANPEISLDNPKLIKLPFGTAVAAATVLAFVLTHWAK